MIRMTEQGLDGILYVAGALIAIVGAVKGVWPAMKWLWNNTIGRRLQRQKDITDTMKLVREQLSPNGGSSIKDIVTQTRDQVQALAAKQEIMADSMLGVIETNRAQVNLSDKMVVMLTQLGDLEFANKPFQDLVGKPLEELEDGSWLSVVHQEDRHEVQEYLDECVVKKRPFNFKFRIYTTQGPKEVIFDGSVGKHSGYFIRVTKID